MEGLVTPAPGAGAPADIPDPFAGQILGSGTTGSTPPPAKTAGPKKPVLGIALRGKLARSVAAGGTLEVPLRVNNGSGTVTAKLTHGKTVLAQAKKRRASGKVTLKLHLGRQAKRGPAKLTLRIGSAKPLVKSVTVTGAH
jgi:hypothetical protein